MTKEEKEKLRKEKLKLEQEELKRQRDEDIKNGRRVYEAREETLEENKKYHWPLYAGLKIQRLFSGYRLHKLNKCPKYYYDKDGKKKKVSDRPIIFAPNHVRKKDIEMLMEAIKKHAILLSGDFENLHGTLSGTLLEKNGIAYLDMEDPYDNEELKNDKKYLKELEEYIKITNSQVLKEEYEKETENYEEKLKNIINDRDNVKEVERQILSTGNNLLKFYEASWNLAENKLIYNGYFSLIQTAVDTNALIIPIAYEQPVNFKMRDKKAYIKFGKPIDFSEYFGVKKGEKRILTFEEKKRGLEIIIESIGTSLYDIMNRYSKVKREDIPVDYWENYKKHVLSEWFFTEEDINKKHFVDKSIVEKEEAFEYLKQFKKTNKNNK